MRELVAVKSPNQLPDLDSLKREALMFNRIAIPELLSTVGWMKAGYRPDNVQEWELADLDWLIENNILYDPEITLDDPRFQATDAYNDYLQYQNALWQVTNSVLAGNLQPDITAPPFSMAELIVRLTSVQLRDLEDKDAYPLLDSNIFSTQGEQASKSDVLQIVINALPVPDESTPWEQILEFRSDSDSKDRFPSLRNWMNEVARAKLSPTEVEEKLEYLIFEFERHMKLHRMKNNKGTMATLFITTAEFLEDLAKFKWSKIVKGLFTVRERKIALLESELKAKGNEIAYIVHASEHFSR